MSSVDSWSPVAPIPDVLGCAYGHLPSLPAQCAPVRGTLAAACRFHPDRNGTAPKFPSPSETVRLCRQGTLEASSNPHRQSTTDLTEKFVPTTRVRKRTKLPSNSGTRAV